MSKLDRISKKLGILLFLTVVLTMVPAGSVLAAEGFCNLGNSNIIKVPCPLGSVDGPAGRSSFSFLIVSIINIALAIVGSVAVLFLIIGGFRYITAYGNEEAAEAAKKMIGHAILGLVIVILSFAIITIIANILVGGRTGVFGP